MKILSVDTSATCASVAVISDGTVLSECTINNKKTHSEKIMPMIDFALKNANLDISDIDFFAVANGPGSFTGLRIGVSTVKALAHATNKKIAGVSTLEGLAYNLSGCRGVIAPIMDARRGQVYNAFYKFEDGNLKEITPPRAISIEECLEELSCEECVYFTGDGVEAFKEQIINTLKEKAHFASPSDILPRASSLGMVALLKIEKGEVFDYNTLMPFYLRKPQAEREYDEKLGKRD